MTSAQPETPPQPVCMCFIIKETDRCPIHLYDRSQTTQHESRKGPAKRVVNTTSSLRRG